VRYSYQKLSRQAPSGGDTKVIPEWISFIGDICCGDDYYLAAAYAPEPLCRTATNKDQIDAKGCCTDGSLSRHQ
jgi:hypothetical protein